MYSRLSALIFGLNSGFAAFFYFLSFLCFLSLCFLSRFRSLSIYCLETLGGASCGKFLTLPLRVDKKVVSGAVATSMCV